MVLRTKQSRNPLFSLEFNTEKHNKRLLYCTVPSLCTHFLKVVNITLPRSHVFGIVKAQWGTY